VVRRYLVPPLGVKYTVVQDRHRHRHPHRHALLVVLQAGLRVTPRRRGPRHHSRVHQVATHLLWATRRLLLVVTCRLVGDMPLTIRRHLLRSRNTILLVVMHLRLRVVPVFLDLLLMVHHHHVFLHPLVLRLAKEDTLHQVDIISSTVAEDGKVVFGRTRLNIFKKFNITIVFHVVHD